MEYCLDMYQVYNTKLASVTDPGVDCKGQLGDSCHIFVFCWNVQLYLTCQ